MEGLIEYMPACKFFKRFCIYNNSNTSCDTGVIGVNVSSCKYKCLFDVTNGMAKLEIMSVYVK